MIHEDDVFSVGLTRKPYGIKGEIIVQFKRAEYADLDAEFYFLRIDGIPVPFLIEDFTYTTDETARVKFEDLNDEKMASQYSNMEVLVDRSLIDTNHDNDSNGGWITFIGYSIINQNDELVGTIIEVDESTINVLLILEKDGEELLIPATEDFVLNLNFDDKIIKMNLPEGLLDN